MDTSNSIRPTGIYQIRDTTAEMVIGPIMTMHHQAAAIRVFTDALKDTSTSLSKHPEDYELVYLGVQDEKTGEINETGAAMIVITGKQWKALQDSAPAT